jgi:decaprenylphospho-beta-D-ribofuranose 2-oxidase
MRRITRANTVRPATDRDIQDLIVSAVASKQTVVPSGAGYGNDAVRNANGITLDLSLLRNVLHWDPEQEFIRVQPGVTIDNLWRTIIGKGRWLEVLPSRMEATIGGCLSLNCTGANAWHAGSIGDYVSSFDVLLPSGEFMTVTPRDNAELFYSVISGLGMLGVITSITLQLRRIQSGRLLMRERVANSLSEVFDIFADESANDGYLIGSINGHAREGAPGFGVVICGDLTETSEPDSLSPRKQGIPASIVKIVSSSIFSRTIPPLFDLVNIKTHNNLLYTQSAFKRNGYARQISIAQFHFPFGLMNYSLRSILSRESYLFHLFVPAMQAQRVFADLLQLSQQAGFVPLWCVMRKHRADPFLLSCQIDGFSLELAYRSSPNDVARLVRLLQEMLNRVIEAGGRLNLDEDKILDAPTFKRMMGHETVNRFLKIKGKYDPGYIFQSNLFRRLFEKESGWY